MKREIVSWDFFLAHAAPDRDMAEALYDLLEPHRTFLDTRSLIPGDDWVKQLPIAQKNSWITVVLVSSKTARAYYQREEIATAITMVRGNENKHRVVPVYLDEATAKSKNVPYGLRLRQGITISQVGGIEEVAKRLKDLLQGVKGSSTIGPIRKNNNASFKAESNLVDAIANMTEEDLITDVIVPLLEVLHPGKVEYVQSSEVGVKSVISFGSDYLRREHVIYVQVKPIGQLQNISAFTEFLLQADSIRKEGVSRKSRQTCIPHECWLVVSQTLPEQVLEHEKPRIDELSRRNTKYVSGEDLSRLLIDYLPEVAASLAKYSTPEIIKLISVLSKHSDGRAFGFPTDRNINDFYVTAALSPHATRAYAAYKGKIWVTDFSRRPVLPVRQLLEVRELRQGNQDLEKPLKDRIVEKVSKGIIQKYDVRAHVKLRNNMNVIRRMHSKNEKLFVDITFKFQAAFQKLLRDTRNAVKNCPSELDRDIPIVKQTWTQLEWTENFVRDVSDEFKVMVSSFSYRLEDTVSEPIRLTIPDPKKLLQMDKVVLVEGPPGCGKTTLLKILAIELLSRTRKVFYLPCSAITSDFRRSSLKEIVRRFSLGSFTNRTGFRKAILIIDGLDEAPFDVSDHILSGFKEFANIVVSARIAFETSIRSNFFHVALAPFNNDERNLFFERWFSKDLDLVNQVDDLIKKYPDIDMHTRLPLIATITVALLQNGFIPKTRAEIYGFRQDLLLSKWDRSRGVKRLIVDNPDAKRRFLRLRRLAYQMHSSGNRRRSIELEELRDVYEESLGEWGYNIGYENILRI